ncbi:DUF4282 domain-containing protein [Bremerella alba]|uniref:GYF domain-containing protein n=1 Tax=Bremerella alba TaxID=980252 RepID=A0A7V8V1Y2_9BACT|nr:DUF4282 domain-containing protein [Bremerella alba]MBA2113415.1 hypothetical protein [Bremerella alba]
MADEFFYKFNPDAPEVGPIDSKTLKQLASSGAIQPESHLRRGTGEWVTASTVKGLFPNGTAASPPEAIPVAPPAASPVAAAPIAAAGTTSAPPEAIPVAPPAAEAGGMSFPDLAQPKAAADVPAGLDSLVLTPKKAGGKPVKKGNASATKKTTPAPAAAKIESPKVETPKAEPAKLETPKVDTPKVEAPKTAAPKVSAPKIDTPKVDAAKAEAPKIDVPKAEPVSAPAAVSPAISKPRNGATNPKASEPPVGRTKSRRKGTGGLGSLFNFDVMIAPTVIKVLFFLVSGLMILGYLAVTGLFLVTAIMTGDTLTIASAAGGAVFALAVTLVYIVIFRIAAEVAMVFFTINDNVRDIHDMLADEQGTID